MPKQGLQMTEGTILKWLVAEGGAVKEGEPLFEMETDKLTITMDAPGTGKLLKIVRKEGETVEITKLIGVIGNDGEDISAILAEGGAPAAAPAAPAAAPAAPAAAPAASAAEYDVAVIGGGPGGYVCAIRAAKLGKKVILVEKRDLGGTCLNRGCIPTKALLHSAEVYHEAKNSSAIGVNVKDVTFDYAVMAKNKSDISAKLRSGVGYLLKGNKVTVVNGEAKLTGATSFAVDGKTYTASNIVLAMGSAPARIPIPGIDLEGVVNSDGVLVADKCPKSVVIIGGGVIGIEFATLFSTLGVKVTVIEMLGKIMGPATDEEASTLMLKILKKRGVDIHLNAKVVSIEKGMKVNYEEDGKACVAEGEQVVVSIGRTAQTKGIGLEELGIKMNRAFVEVDDELRTSIPNIFAIGDITGKIQLAHVASAQGLTAAANAAGGHNKMSYDIVPSCIYTSPEIASVGLNEQQAKEKGLNVKIGKFAVAGNGRSKIMGEAEGFCKLITDAVTGEIYGAVIVAPRATDMISEIGTAMKAEATLEEIADTIHPHPTVSEIIMESAFAAQGLSVHQM